MADQSPPPMTPAEAKARLLASAEHEAGSNPWTSMAVPAAVGALLLGFLASRRRRRGLGLMSLGALAANPALRSLALGLVTSAAGRLVKDHGK